MAAPDNEQYHYKYYVKFYTLRVWYCKYRGESKFLFNAAIRELKTKGYERVTSYMDRAIYPSGTWAREQRDV